jgi:hypothetical protein
MRHNYTEGPKSTIICFTTHNSNHDLLEILMIFMVIVTCDTAGYSKRNEQLLFQNFNKWLRATMRASISDSEFSVATNTSYFKFSTNGCAQRCAPQFLTRIFAVRRAVRIM